MRPTEIKNFKPRPTALIFNAIMGVLSLILALFLFWSLMTMYMDISVKILVSLLFIGSLLFGYYLLSFFWKLGLTISNQGIRYTEPFLTVYCEWDHIKGAASSDKILLLRLDQTIKLRRNVIRNQGIKEEFVPIHLFVKNWKDQKQWQQNALLASIAFYLPGLDKEVIKDGNK